MAIKRVKKRSIPDLDKLVQRRGGKLLGDLAYRRLLDNIDEKCYVEAEDTGQFGEVVKVYRDKYGIPAAVEVEYTIYDDETEENGITGRDCIALPEITFWEPFDHDAPNEDYEDRSDYEDYYLSHGYEWDENHSCLIHPETGDIAVW